MAICAYAQADIASLKARLDTCRVELSYKYDVAGPTSVKVSGSGHIVLDGKCYKAEGNGLSFICNGTTRWTVDQAAKEVYIENSAGTEEFLTDTSTGKSRVSDFKMEGNRARGSFLDPKSGNNLIFQLDEIKMTKSGIYSKEFEFDTSKLDKTWIITDLR